jgi:hypothetical protein
MHSRVIQVLAFEIRIKATPCWYAFSPKRGTFSCFLFSKGPFSERLQCFQPASLLFHYITQQMFTGCIDVDSSDSHNELLYYPVLLLILIHIMLVGLHQWLWVNFHQFGQRIRQSSPNRNRTTNVHHNWKFLSSNFRCWIYRSSSLWNYKTCTGLSKRFSW